MTRRADTTLKGILKDSELARFAAGGPRGRVTGLMGPARSLAAATIAAESRGPLLVVVPDERRLGPAVSDLGTFLAALGSDRPVLPFPAFALDPYRGLAPHLEVTSARLRALVALAERENVVVVATAAALLYRTASPRLLEDAILRLRVGDRVEPGELERHLVATGFRHEDPVTTPGDFTRRGGILDIFPPVEAEPVRLELLDDELEEIRRFDRDSQRSEDRLGEIRITPANEWPLAEAQRRELRSLLGEGRGIEELLPMPGIGCVLPRLETFRSSVIDFLEGGRLLAEEPPAILRAAELEWERVLSSFDEADEEPFDYAEPRALLMDLGELESIIAERSVSLEEMALLDEYSESTHLSTQIMPSYRGRVTEFVEEVNKRIERFGQVRVFVPAEGMMERYVELFSEAGLSSGQPRDDDGPEGQVILETGRLSQGFVVPELDLAVFTASDIFAEAPRPGRRRRVDVGRFLSDFRDLKVGDYVVHTEHGIGIFTGLMKLEPDATTEYVVLEYVGGDKLYVPVNRLDLLEKYSSAEAARPRLDKLGGTSWERVKKRVKKSMRDMATEFLKLYAARKAAAGHAFPSDHAWVHEFDGLFEFEETPDQLQAIEDVKRDMETPSPMDRLICGDVGYGKTEVAMRAAFKAVNDGKQVAVLVPTTVLCFQHLGTFRERFAAFPVRVEMLSRFRTRKEQKEVLGDLEAGKVDIVIGTHRLLSKDVVFHDLGLLVVDEEQRFGVSHKERLKKMRYGVDSLTLTATPIPRTLHMSLSGIRDLSIIETPPKDRMAIQTHITRLDSKVLAEAIRYELGRGGQVYFVHNRIGSIYSMSNYVQRLVPEARVAVAHGQMKEHELEDVMLRFVRHDFDVLVSTTIVENGLDIPRVNTLVVNRADRFGLSQLYQLRGRVGRSNRRAYAYLLVPEEARLSGVARRRLAAIREFSELGAGFRIAALDLELRGAGNLLGGEQHGHIEAVGFDLYCRLLDEAVQEMSGRDVPLARRASLNLRIELRIPEDFIPDINQRMSLYKRASSARARETVEVLKDETRDRYGPLPEAVLSFFEYARLQILADELSLEAIERERGALVFRLGEELLLGPEKLAVLAQNVPGAHLGASQGEASLRVPLPGTEPPEILSEVREVLLRLSSYSKMS